MLAALALLSFAQDPAPAPGIVRDWLVLAPLEPSGRRPFRPDAVFAKHLTERRMSAPKKGDALSSASGVSQTWSEQRASADGSVAGNVGWAYARVESAEHRVVIAKLAGAARLYVNGAGFVGDVYGLGLAGVPVTLRKGGNDVYVTGTRGSFTLELAASDSPVLLTPGDTTRPDALVSQGGAVGRASVLAWNATTARGSWTLATGGELFATAERKAIEMPPLCPLKLSFDVAFADGRFAPKEPGTARFGVHVRSDRTDARDNDASFDVDVRAPLETRRITYRSRIDGSTQYAAFVPAQKSEGAPQRAVLSLHGAGVDAYGQARSYAPKDDFAIVAPTNRRQFGFDWQDWGRIDAYEALEAMPGIDARRVYVTGHSMGGHGTWHFAANDPDRVIALAPSAGWSDFDSYGGRPDGALKALWHAADAASKTLDLVANLAQIPASVLHGEADDNVPASEGRKMVKALEDAGAKPRSHFAPNAGHWWDGERSPGADCVDWPGIFELFRATAPAPATLALDFTTVDPGVDARHHWLEVRQLVKYGERARVQSELANDVLALRTTNVRRLRLVDPPAGWEQKRIEIDSSVLEVARGAGLEFVRAKEGWRAARPSDDAPPVKSPESSGPFKRAFDHDFVLVHGTQGSDDEDRELFERARSDLQTWWYRANATPRIASDVEFLALRGDCNVILYGNADTNSAWEAVLDLACPIEARRGKLTLGKHEWIGTDLAAVFVFPRSGTKSGTLVGVFADTGMPATRLGYTLAPFVSGVGYPDYAIFSSEVLSQGDGGVLAAGFFDHEWSIDPSAFVRNSAK